MRRVAAIVILLIVTAFPCAAQQRDERLRSANRKINIGLVMIGAGALIAPLTAINDGAHNDSTMMTTGIGLIVVGSGVVWSGAIERRRALRPQTTIGVSIGRRSALQVTRVW
jgi:anaerobic C4-dicarboxylate transporter